jgi:hypothetical protein
MSKGYYNAYTSTNDVIHGGSYAINLDNIDFITWKKNYETGEFWVKFHTNSGKEIRLKVTLVELNDILQAWGNSSIVYYGDENDNEKQ